MQLQTAVYILLCLLSIGVFMLLYVLIKDRIDILRSLKPNSFSSFLGFDCAFSSGNFCFKYFFAGLLFNIFALFIWFPFWLVDKSFHLGIFEENNKK